MKDPELLAMLGGVIAVLLISSVVTSILCRKGGETPTLVNLRQRVRAWWWMMLVFGGSLALGRSGVFGFYTLLSFLALREFLTLSPTPRGDHRTLAWVFFLILPIPGYEGENAKLLFFVVLVTQISDVVQYVFGKCFGKHPIVPTVSPSKTREGLLYGGAAAVAIGTSLWWATPFTPLATAGMATLLVLAGFLGGLVMSAVKRSLGAKDWGQGIPGHGGVLDRLDSLLFGAPIFFHVTGYYFGTNMAATYPRPEWFDDLRHLWM